MVCRILVFMCSLIGIDVDINMDMNTDIDIDGPKSLRLKSSKPEALRSRSQKPAPPICGCIPMCGWALQGRPVASHAMVLAKSGLLLRNLGFP